MSQIPQGLYDWKIEIYRENFFLVPDFVLTPSLDINLANYPLETPGQDPCPVVLPVFSDIWWTNKVDCDVDGYFRSARLNWDVDVLNCNGSVQVYQKVYVKLTSQGPELFAQIGDSTPVYSVSGCTYSDAHFKDIIGGGHEKFDFKIVLYKVGQTSPFSIMTGGVLSNVWFESDFLDACVLPDLRCFVPPPPFFNWDSSIVVSNVPGTVTQTQLALGKPSYIDWSANNWGPGWANDTTVSTLYIDGDSIYSWLLPPPDPPRVVFARLEDFEYTFTSAGQHTIRMVHDNGSTLNENDENNNSCEITVSAGCLSGYGIGTGLGVTGNFQNHIDIYCNDSTGFYELVDSSRRAVANPPSHNHNGQLKWHAAIITHEWINDSLHERMADGDTVWDDVEQRPGVDGQVFTAYTYDYLVDSLDRNGIDSTGTDNMLSIVESDENGERNNSQYDYTCDCVTFFRSQGVDRFSLAGSRDVVAHEWGHGITKYASKLIGRKEPGALAESFSDMFGVAVAFANGDQDWLVGENSYLPPSRSISNLANPELSDSAQPHTYGGAHWVDTSSTNDSGGIHTNRGVPNKMFYLFAAPGPHSHNGITVNGIGIHNALKVMFAANEGRFWSPTSNFPQAMRGSLLAAVDLEPQYGVWTGPLLQAWEAVKVCRPKGDVNIDGSTTAADVAKLIICTFSDGMEAGLCDRCNSDVDCDGVPTGADIIVLLNMTLQLYGGQPLCPQ